MAQKDSSLSTAHLLSHSPQLDVRTGRERPSRAAPCAIKRVDFRVLMVVSRWII